VTEQSPSAEALEIADRIRAPNGMKCAAEIDALVKQRVFAERNWWQNRERQRLEQISTLQKTVQGFQRALAERPAPAVVDYTERAREEELQELWLDLIEKDDRISPEEYPDMALLTREEFFGYLKHYASTVASEVLK
jgi:hypothetical protein